MSAYALISSTIGSYRILLIGVAEGMQPLASKAYGASQNRNATPTERIAAYDEIRHIRNKAIRTAIAASVLLFLFTIATASFYPALYGYQGEAAAARLSCGYAYRCSAHFYRHREGDQQLFLCRRKEPLFFIYDLF